MGKAIIILCILCLGFGCNEKEDEQIPVYFSPDSIDRIDIWNISGLFPDLSDTVTFYYSNDFLLKQSGYLVGRTYNCNKRIVRITVFDNIENAISGADAYRKDIAGYVIDGSKEKLKLNWWYLDGLEDRQVWAVYLNTFIQMWDFEYGESFDKLFNNYLAVQNRISVLSKKE